MNRTESDVKYNDKNDKIIREEDRIAITTKELCEYFKAVKNKPISSDNVKHTYLNQLINEGIIDYLPSKIDTRQNIYYPLVTEKISITSIISPIDNLSYEKLPIYEKIITNITEDWILSEIKADYMLEVMLKVEMKIKIYTNKQNDRYNSSYNLIILETLKIFQ